MLTWQIREEAKFHITLGQTIVSSTEWLWIVFHCVHLLDCPCSIWWIGYLLYQHRVLVYWFSSYPCASIHHWILVPPPHITLVSSRFCWIVKQIFLHTAHQKNKTGIQDTVFHNVQLPNRGHKEIWTKNSRVYTNMLKTKEVRDDGAREIPCGTLVPTAILEIITAMCFACLLCKHCSAYFNIYNFIPSSRISFRVYIIIPFLQRRKRLKVMPPGWNHKEVSDGTRMRLRQAVAFTAVTYTLQSQGFF